MNPYIQSLYKSSKKNERHIIGLMSGTSLDGLDIAFCKIAGSGINTKVEVIHFETIAYSEETKEKIKKVFAKKEVDFPYLAMLNEWIGILHGRLINDFLFKYQIDKTMVDVVASHGQTVMHVPKHQHKYPDFPNATLQIGDGDHIAMATGMITISDFRQKHLAGGGEGAPLAVYGDYLLFSKHGEDRILLNLGGIGNFTYLPANLDDNPIFVTDTGPSNVLMDVWTKVHFGLPYDKNADLAQMGEINQPFLDALLEQPFFRLPFPKSTGPEVFNMELIMDALTRSNQTLISHHDILASLNRCSAVSIATAILDTIGDKRCHIYASGGGVHNPLLLGSLEELMPNCIIHLSDELGINADVKEAVLFALLANETLSGTSYHFGNTNNIPNICMGKISFPA